MRLALITDGIWPYVLGGMQKHSYYLCKYLAQNKIQVDLYHFNQSNYDVKKLEFFTDEEKQFIQSILVDFPSSPRFPGHYIYNSYQYSKQIFSAAKSQLQSYDFIYTKGFAGWFLINQKRRHSITCAPIGLNFHGYEMFQPAPSIKSAIQIFLFLRRPVKKISLNADVVFSYGGKITKLIQDSGVKKENIFELPSGVEASFILPNSRLTDNKIKILYLGRYERRKGIEELNQAIQLYLNQDSENNLEFQFVGPIPEDKKVNSSHCIYHGEIRDKAELKNKIQACDILICASWSEGMPNVILEGMACGLAIIATDVGATSILVDEENGWLLPEPRVDLLQALFFEISQLKTTSLDDKKEHSLNKIKNKFTWEKLITQLIDKIKSYESI